MALKSFLAVLVIFILLPTALKSQNNSDIRTKIISNISDTISIDSLLILPSTFFIYDSNNNLLDTSNYKLDPKGGFVVINSNNFSAPLKIEYRVFPFDLSKEYSHKKWNILTKNEEHEELFYNYFQKKDNRSDLLGLSDFQKDGSISRAVSVGNSQNLSVMSHMNLQLAGNISPKLKLVASISDDNIPIQPDGNTQQLQDFDKVFVQLQHEKGQITAGDFELKSPKSYFMKYHKKVQGANASVNLDLAKGQKLEAYGGVAISRGKFSKNTITGIEGNQGPYKLIGANFETAIIVLSGTERVFVDGKELKRGQNYDYVINYNTAEITFTPNMIITKDKRISIEFQYSNNNYVRYVANAGFAFTNKKLLIEAHYFTETDIKSQSLDQELSNTQLQLLYGIGDSLDKAISPSVDSVLFTGEQILYKKVDSMGYSPVYVYSTSADSAFYSLSFSLVGVGNGNYVQKQSDANGRVFMWVKPQNGIPQGNYDPVVLLVTPKKTQMVSSTLDYKIFKGTRVYAEFAVSDVDQNLFSNFDDEDNIGTAYKIGAENKLGIGKKEKWNLISNMDFEHIEEQFNPIQRFREVEFYRDWNASDLSDYDQKKINANIELKYNKFSSIKYNFQNYWSQDRFDGKRNAVDLNAKYKSWRIKASLSSTNTEDMLQNTSFIRHKVKAEKDFRYFAVGVEEDAENNKFTKVESDTLYANSYKYQQYNFYLKNTDSLKHNFKINYKIRDDYTANITSMKPVMKANEIGFVYKLIGNKSNSIYAMANYRQLEISDTLSTNQKAEETSTGRIDHVLNMYKGTIKANSFYELGSGMESRKDFSYLEVVAGQGVYSWIDYNDNGVKELNEFEIAVFKDQANYIRIYMPSNEYVKTYNNSFSTSIMINPAKLWRRSSSKILKAFSHFSNQLVYRSSIKTLNPEVLVFANPINNNISDTSLMSLSSNFRNTFYFNRGHSKYGIDYSFIKNNNKILMMNGYQGRSRTEHQIKIRWNISKMFLVQLEVEKGENVFLSDYFSDKNYNINSDNADLKLTYQPNRVFRISLPFGIERKNNKVEYGGQESETMDIGLQTKYNILSKGSWTASIKYLQVKYSEEVTGSISFEMLQGYLPGSNYIWTINYQRNLLNNLQLNIMYNGRKSESSSVVHIGSVQLRAFF